MNYDDALVSRTLFIPAGSRVFSITADTCLVDGSLTVTSTACHTGTLTYTPIDSDDGVAWEGLCSMPFDDDTPASEAAALKASIQQGIKEAKGGIVETAISALHRQHGYNGRPNRYEVD